MRIHFKQILVIGSASLSKKILPFVLAIAILMLAGVLISGCTDSAEEDTIAEDVMPETSPAEDMKEDPDTVVDDRKDYGVIMEYYGMMKPSELELNIGDTIAWRNGKPQGTYTLVSDDGLFENQEMDHNDMYSYTFTKSGTYTFSVKDYPDMILKVMVR